MIRWHKKFKVLRCYILILGWLGIILLFLSYWRVETSPGPPPAPLRVNVGGGTGGGSSGHDRPRTKKLRHLCNPPDRINRHQEGVLPSNYQLEGVVVLLRHGDRGPLLPVRNMSNINCGHRSYGTPTYKKYVSDILNASRSNHYVNMVGPFVRYPLLPGPARCGVGQLTPQGVLQHLQLGLVLKQVYLTQFSLLGPRPQQDDIVVYSTKYRRTFQSLLAFLYSFLPDFATSQIRVQEGKGISFCGSECRCERTEYFDQKYEQERRDYRKSHPGVVELVSRLGSMVKPGPEHSDIVNPMVMRDALLSYVCHGAPLPCSNGRCVKPEDVTSLVSYEEWEGRQKRTSAQRRAAKLRSYVLLKGMVSALEGMMGAGRPRVVIYSGHDKTIKYLLDAMSVPNYQLPYYASRLVVELYHNSTAPPQQSLQQPYFFRLVYNGKDITKSIGFCESIIVKQLRSGSVKRGTISLCPISSLTHYITPELFFQEFNAASFKDACHK